MDSERRSARLFAEGIALCLVGAVCFSTKAIFVKLAYRDTTVDSVSLLALRMLFSLPIFLISAAFSSSRKSNVRFTGRQWIAIALIGCMGYYVSSLLDFIGLVYISAGIERLILFVYPTLVLLISLVIYGQRVSSSQWLALMATYAGLALAFTLPYFLRHQTDRVGQRGDCWQRRSGCHDRSGLLFPGGVVLASPVHGHHAHPWRDMGDRCPPRP